MGLGLRIKGRSEIQVAAIPAGDLTEEDIASLAESRGSKPPAVKKLRDSHHALAKALANGLRDAEAAAVTGYQLATISILKSDPAFKELLSFYRSATVESAAIVADRFRSIALDVASAFHERVNDPEREKDISDADLIKAMGEFADRAGHGKVSRTVNQSQVEVYNYADILKAARERANGVVEGSVSRLTTSEPVSRLTTSQQEPLEASRLTTSPSGLTTSQSPVGTSLLPNPASEPAVSSFPAGDEGSPSR